MEHDALGDRMKAYEAVEDRRLDSRLPIYARIDGRGFSRFTAGMARPYDAGMARTMIETASGLVERTHAKIAFVQSDEISLVWLADGDTAQTIFDGRIQKLCSVLASLSTALFMAALTKDDRLCRYAERLPHFDCRVLQLPSKTEAANMLLWRELDAQKNAISGAARGAFSHKALHGKNGAEMLSMMSEANVDFAGYPVCFRRGTFLRRVSFYRPFTSDELARIPEKHRPADGSCVGRSEVRSIDMPPFRAVINREAVVFDGADPTTPPLPADPGITRGD